MSNEAVRKSDGVYPIDQINVIGKQEEIPGKNYNILNVYRSYTYNFTLAALTKEQLNDPPQNIQEKDLNFIILKSGGKGNQIFNPDKVSNVTVRAESLTPNDDSGLFATEQTTELGKGLVNGFNEESPGRFDMYINNVEILTLPTFNPITHATPASGIKFDVYEPYSINGFFEALNVAAISSGFNSYVDAGFLFRLSFVGYPDKEGITEPEKIPYSTRDFYIKFSSVNLEVTEQGTKYTCSAVLFHEGSLGKKNQLKQNISIEGKNQIKDILKDFANKATEHEKKTLVQGTDKELNLYDEYQIEYRNENFEVVEENEISKSIVNELLKSENVYAHADYGKDDINQYGQRNVSNDPATARAASQQTPASTRLPLDKMSISFKRGSHIHECISAIIRDSEYSRNILLNLTNNKAGVDVDGMIKYYTILVYSSSKGYSDIQKKEVYKYTYVIMPYKMHFTSIPGYQNEQWSKEKITDLIFRSYNYLYYGQNTDLLSFKLDYKALYLQNVVNASANNFYLSQSGALALDNRAKAVISAVPDKNIDLSLVNRSPLYPDPSDDKIPNISALPLNMHPWSILARNMHESVVNGYTTNLESTIEILGDPGYLVNTSPGKTLPELDKNSKVLLTNGSVNALGQQILIDITFRNPTDIGEDGFYKFIRPEAPFSGVYLVTRLRHTFVDGVFKQRFDIKRMNGQISKQKKNISETNIGDRFKSKPDPRTEIRQDESPVSQRPTSGVRAQGQGVLNQIRSIASGASTFASALSGALTAPITDALGAINQATSQLSDVSARITSAVQGVNYQIAQAGEKLGLSPSQILQTNPITLNRLLKLAENVAPGVNLAEAEKAGFNLNFPLSKLRNLPPVQPKATAPAPQTNRKDLEDLLKEGGTKSLALSYGVKTVDKISGSIVTAQQIGELSRNYAKPNISNPLAGLNNKLPPEDYRRISNQNLSNLNTVSPSIEVNLRLSNANLTEVLKESVTSQLGSKLSSPLTRYINSNNL